MEKSNKASENSTLSTDTELNSQITTNNFIAVVIQLPIYILVILIAIAHTTLISIQPRFRHNKLNWLTVNVCLTAAWFSLMLIWTNLQSILSTPYSTPCHIHGYMIDMSACQFTYSHCVATFSRLLTIIYPNKHLFRIGRFLWLCSACGWIISVLIPIPLLFGNNFVCSYSTQSLFLPYYTLCTTLILPVAIITFCNMHILLFARNSTRRVRAAGAARPASHARDMHLFRVMIFTFVIFIAGWTPAFVLLLFNVGSTLPASVVILFRIAPSVTVLHDVLFLICSNRAVRIYLKGLICKRPAVFHLHGVHNEQQPNGRIIPNH